VYIDLGARDGVGAGAELELWHEVVAKDRAPARPCAIGLRSHDLRREGGDRISIARAGDDLAKRVLAGDHVRLISAPRRYEDPWSRRSRRAGSAAALSRHPMSGTPGVDQPRVARQAWQDTLGKHRQADHR